MLDIFNDDAYGVVSLTAAIDKLPYKPGRIGRMGLYQESGVNTLDVAIEERHGKLSLLNTAARGTAGQTSSRRSRKLRSFRVPHIPHDDAVMADEVQGVRAFGSENATEGVAALVNEKMGMMKQDHEVTWEYHRVGGLKGIVLDSDGSTIYNWFTEFGITETVIDFAFSTTTTEIKTVALSVIRAIDEAIGGTPYTGVHAFCGDNFFDEFVTHPLVKDSYERFVDGKFFRDQQAATGVTGDGGFTWGGITWENYRGKVGTTDFIDTDEARFFPVGAPNIFLRRNAPADFVEAVNTIGKPVYAKQERMKFDKGIELHTQSNPLHICTRPAVLIKGTHS